MKISRISKPLLAAVLTLSVNAGFAFVPTAIYTFDSSPWVVGATTPLLNMAPDTASGLPAFRASFTSSPTVGAFSVGTLRLNPSFSGNNLYQPGLPPGETLTITLSQPINSVHLDFQQFAPGHFDLTSAAGNASASTDSQIGSLDFHSNVPFTQFTLAAFYLESTPIPLGIDNLVLAVPEPSTLTMVGLGAFAWVICRRRK